MAAGQLIHQGEKGAQRQVLVAAQDVASARPPTTRGQPDAHRHVGRVDVVGEHIAVAQAQAKAARQVERDDPSRGVGVVERTRPVHAGRLNDHRLISRRGVCLDPFLPLSLRRFVRREPPVGPIERCGPIRRPGQHRRDVDDPSHARAPGRLQQRLHGLDVHLRRNSAGSRDQARTQAARWSTVCAPSVSAASALRSRTSPGTTSTRSRNSGLNRSGRRASTRSRAPCASSCRTR